MSGKPERGYLSIPKGADVVSFLLFERAGQQALNGPDQITLKVLFDRYFAARPKVELRGVHVLHCHYIPPRVMPVQLD